MEISDIIMAILDVEPEGINGRTVIQKLCYFASVKLKGNAGYKAAFYGPFSSSVSAHLQTLVGFDFVVERMRRTIHDRVMYSYSLTEDGQELAQNIKQKQPREYSIIRDIVRKCRRIVRFNFYVLSWAAKVHFILEKTGKAMTYKEAIAAGRWFGWKLGERQIESGVKLLSALGLIREK